MGNSERDFSPENDRTVWLYIVFFVGFTFSLLAFWPGFMEIDSFMQYARAKGLLSLNDWHPISMAILWRILLYIYYIYDGPELLSQFINFGKISPLNAKLLNEITYIQCQSPRDDLAFPINYYGEAWQTSEPKYRKKRICNRVIALASTTDTNSIFDEGYLKDPDHKDPDIKRLWFQNVMGSPLRYLQYRAIVYRTFLRPFSYAEPSYYLYDTIEGQDIVPNYYRPSMKVINPLGTCQFLMDYVNLSAQYLSILFRPFFWLLLLIFSVGFSFYKKDRFTFFVSLSGLLYLLMYFFFLPSPDFRYAYYSIFATITAIFGILKTYVD